MMQIIIAVVAVFAFGLTAILGLFDGSTDPGPSIIFLICVVGGLYTTKVIMSSQYKNADEVDAGQVLAAGVLWFVFAIAGFISMLYMAGSS